MNNYLTIQNETITETIIEKSRFITYLKNVQTEEEARLFLESIRKKHFDATHNCYAYLIGPTMEIQKSSDDGEPSGTAGIPILEALKNNHLTNVICIVTRYFGGVKLGAGGLVRAYSKSCVEAINASIWMEYKEGLLIECCMDYQQVPKIENFATTNNLSIVDKKYYEEAIYQLVIPKEKEDDITNELMNLTNGKIEIQPIEYIYYETILKK